jgi:tetratricopeptide (TPR) repeat protein
MAGETADYLRTVARARARSGSGGWAEAAVLWERVVERNPVNGNHWDRLGEARYALGDYGGALDAYRTVLKLGVWPGAERETTYPGEVAYRVACCLARLGQHAQALDALADAFDRGFRDLDRARGDEHLEPLRQQERFKRLVGAAGQAEGSSRDQGWRDDLRFLAREVKRRAYAPFRHLPEQRFDAAVADLDRALPGLTDAQAVVEMMKLLRGLGDGHARINLPESMPDLRRELPLQFYLFEEGLFVIAADPRHADLLGAQVLRFGGKPAEDVVAALDPVITRDNEWWPRQVAPNLLRQLPLVHALGAAPDPSRVTLSLLGADGAGAEVGIDAEPSLSMQTWALPCPPGWRFYPETLASPLPLYLRNCGAAYWFEHVAGQRLVYFQFNSVFDDPDEPLEAFSRRLFAFIEANPVDRLVIDLRWNSGGNTFLVPPLLHRLIGCGKINRPGGLFVIIGRKTFSAAQNTATLIERHTEAVFVGEPTGSSPNFVGETDPFALPYSKLQVNVSDLYWETSWPMDERAWIAPELYTPPTFAAYRDNRDPALEAILAVIGSEEHLPGW